MRRREQTALWEREVFLDQSDQKPHLWGQLEGVVTLVLVRRIRVWSSKKIDCATSTGLSCGVNPAVVDCEWVVMHVDLCALGEES